MANATGIVGAVSIGATEMARAARTRIVVSENWGGRVNYRFRVNARDLKKGDLADPIGKVTKFSNSAKAEGFVKQGKDSYTIPGYAEITDIWVEGVDDGCNITIKLSNNLGSSQSGLLNIRRRSGGGPYTVCVSRRLR